MTLPSALPSVEHPAPLSDQIELLFGTGDVATINTMFCDGTFTVKAFIYSAKDWVIGEGRTSSQAYTDLIKNMRSI